MANLPISGLTASASNLASTDLAPVVQTAGVGPVKMTGLQLAGGLLGSTTFNGSTVTTSSPVLNLTQTWNDGAGGTVTFTGLKFNATDTASASGSLLLDLQVGGASRFAVAKSGNVAAENVTSRRFIGINANITVSDQDSRIILSSGSTIQWTSGSSGSTPDTTLRRANTATLQLGAADAAAPVAQTFKVQSVVAGTTNTAGANFTIQGSQGTGTGAGGSIIFQVAPAGSSGTAQNAYSTALTIASDKSATFAGNIFIPAGGTIGNGVNVLAIGSGNIYPANAGLTVGTAAVPFTSLFVTTNVAWSSGGTADTILTRDAANTLALRNGGTSGTPVPQTFNIYNYWASASDYERMTLRFSGAYAILQPQIAGTGTAKNVAFKESSGNVGVDARNGSGLYFYASGADNWFINTAGHFLAGTDNTYDIGAATTTRPRNLFIAGYEQLTEVTAPAAPAANSVRIYAEDNGSGKTRLMALFATGAAQQIAIEP